MSQKYSQENKAFFIDGAQYYVDAACQNDVSLSGAQTQGEQIMYRDRRDYNLRMANTMIELAKLAPQ